MSEQDVLYQHFLDQLQSLEEFRQVHRERNPGAAVDAEDPAVRRLLEALAYFTARTHIAAQDNVRCSLDRLISEYFDFLTSPLPALATVEFTGAERLIDPVLLPEGSALHVGTPDGAL